MLSFFRKLSIAEGLSFLALLFIAMPLKYYFSIPQWVPYVGMVHGVLFMLYIAVSLIVSHQQRWSVAFWGLTLLCSVTPFACFLLHGKLKDEQENEALVG